MSPIVLKISNAFFLIKNMVFFYIFLTISYFYIRTNFYSSLKKVAIEWTNHISPHPPHSQNGTY